jgi:hypothetical protein
MRGILLAATVVSMTAMALPFSKAAGQDSAAWPAACICRSDNPKYPRARTAVFTVDEHNLAALRERFAEIGNTPLHKTITIRNACSDPGICAERRQVPAEDAQLSIRVLGCSGSSGLFDASDTLRPERLDRQVRVILWGSPSH